MSGYVDHGWRHLSGGTDPTPVAVPEPPLTPGAPLTGIVPAPISSGSYDAYGIIDQFPSGKLIIVYRSGTTHDTSADASIKMRTSSDGGATWTAASTVASEAGKNLLGAAGGVTSTGRIVVFYARVTTGGAWIDQGYRYSDDEGATWSSFTTVSHGSDTTFGPYGPVLQMPSGRLMQGLSGRGGGSYSAYVIFSDDDGASWGGPVTVVTSTTILYAETAYAYLGSGSIVALANHDASTTFKQLLSRDSGATWTVVADTGFDSWTAPAGGPAWLRGYSDELGRAAVACYWCNREDKKVRATYALASALPSGVAAWGGTVDLATATAFAIEDMGYPAVIQSAGSQYAIGWFYDGTNTGGVSTATRIVFLGVGSPAASTPITAGLISAKGDLFVGASAGVVGVLPVGADDQVPTADASEPLGIRWVTPTTGGGGGGAVTQIARTVLGADAASIDITGIAGTYNHLKIVLAARSDQSGAVVANLRLNNDSGTNYAYANLVATSSGPLSTGADNVSSARIGAIPGSAALAGMVGVVELLLFEYASTTWYKMWSGVGGRVDALSAGNVVKEDPFGVWVSTAAVNRVTVRPGSGNLKAGSTLTIYGVS